MLFHGWIKRRFETDETEIEALRARVLKLEEIAGTILETFTGQLTTSNAALKAALKPYETRTVLKGTNMNPILQALADQVTATTTVEGSAVTLINGFAQRIQDAVTAALAGGVTAAQLAPVQDEVNAMKASADALAAAVAANTPAPPAPPTP